ncbi:hypothetical protein DIPPA_16620 [Diplonema papillatum]|nr:hypothetical protein DIPPA_16620 [Diplonema papillatum]
MSVMRGTAWRVRGSTIPYQFSKYNIPQFHRKVDEQRNLPGIAASSIMKEMDSEGRALFRWRRRVRNIGLWNKGVTEGKKSAYNTEWVGFMRSRLHECLGHRKLVLQEEQALLADMYGHSNVASLLRAQPTDPDAPRQLFIRPANEVSTRPVTIKMIKHRPERDQEVSYLRPQGQHAYRLSFYPGKGTATQVTD